MNAPLNASPTTRPTLINSPSINKNLSSSSKATLHKLHHRREKKGSVQKILEKKMDKRDQEASYGVGLSSNMENDEEVSPGIRTSETMLRLVPVALCVSALVVMLKNSESNDFGSLSYSNLGAFRYLVHANGICAGYSLISAAIAAMPRSPSTMPRAWTLFFLDQLLTYIILAAGAVSSEVLYLAYKGDESITWSEACSSFGGFCHKATASVIITFIVVAFYAVLSLVSSYKLFSKYDAPAANPSKGIEVAVFGN